MAHPAGKKEESRARILASAGRGFRSHGYGGLGVDGLAKSAGVTSGAFYAHFRSKKDAFREAVAAGMADLADGIAGMKAAGGAWVARFIDFYLTDRRSCDIAESCALQSLTGEVARAGPETRSAYEEQLRRAIDTLASGIGSGNSVDDQAEAIALLAMLSGGVSMARAVEDETLADAIVAAVRRKAERQSH